MANRNGTIPTLLLTDDLELMLIAAVRYSLGRRTYMVTATTSYITPLLQLLKDSTLRIMQEDIERQETWGYGDACDTDDWMTFHEKILAEIRSRELQ